MMMITIRILERRRKILRSIIWAGWVAAVCFVGGAQPSDGDGNWQVTKIFARKMIMTCTILMECDY